MVSKLWQSNIEDDERDPVQTYKRLNNLTQEQFNNEMFEGVRRFVTWDIPSMKEANIKHIDKHQYSLIEVGAGKKLTVQTRKPVRKTTATTASS